MSEFSVGSALCGSAESVVSIKQLKLLHVIPALCFADAREERQYLRISDIFASGLRHKAASIAVDEGHCPFGYRINSVAAVRDGLQRKRRIEREGRHLVAQLFRLHRRFEINVDAGNVTSLD